jgi:hypothetical protein
MAVVSSARSVLMWVAACRGPTKNSWSRRRERPRVAQVLILGVRVCEPFFVFRGEFWKRKKKLAVSCPGGRRISEFRGVISATHRRCTPLALEHSVTHSDHSAPRGPKRRSNSTRPASTRSGTHRSGDRRGVVALAGKWALSTTACVLFR